MDQKTAAALSERLSPHVSLSNDRRQTLAFLTVGMLSARTTNLSVLASERPGPALVSSTYRRLQRFFQFAELGEDWAAPVVAGLLRLDGPLTLVLDRTNWKVGRREINLLVLAVATRRHRVALMWTVLDRAGNSGATERIALIERFIAVFGKAAHRAPARRPRVHRDGVAQLSDRARHSLRDPDARGAAGHHGGRPQRQPRPPARRAGRTTRAPPSPSTPWPAAACPAPRSPSAPSDPRAASRSSSPPTARTARALAAYRKRWAIECFFADAKTRGLNLEDTRLTAPRKLALLVAILVIAIAWASATAAGLLGRTAPPRKKHGYPAKSVFRIGLDRLRRQIRAASPQAFEFWNALNATLDTRRVV